MAIIAGSERAASGSSRCPVPGPRGASLHLPCAAGQVVAARMVPRRRRWTTPATPAATATASRGPCHYGVCPSPQARCRKRTPWSGPTSPHGNTQRKSKSCTRSLAQPSLILQEWRGTTTPPATAKPPVNDQDGQDTPDDGSHDRFPHRLPFSRTCEKGDRSEKEEGPSH